MQRDMEVFMFIHLEINMYSTESYFLYYQVLYCYLVVF